MKLVTHTSRYPEGTDLIGEATAELSEWLPPEMPLQTVNVVRDFVVAEVLTPVNRKAPEGWLWEFEVTEQAWAMETAMVERLVRRIEALNRKFLALDKALGHPQHPLLTEMYELISAPLEKGE